MMEPRTNVFSQQGFTLVETMVALVIFSVGLLGLAGLQMAGTQSNHSAMMRTIATQHSYDMADRIRSNQAGFASGDYDNLVNSTCGTPPCPTVADDDYYAWTTELSDALPGGKGQVTGGGASVTVTVFWDENRTGATGTNCDPNDPQDLKCIRVTVVP